MLELITPAGLFPEAVKAFQKHGCRVEVAEAYCIVALPEGTERKEIFPRASWTARFRITLPDGYEMREVRDKCSAKSILYFS